jgi:hypoxia up-regulated 1
MIGEGTAVALNYAMTRDFPTFNTTTGEGEKEYHIIYDSGAMSTTHIELIGTGWQEVGGVMLDLTIQEVLVADFIQKTGKTAIREDKRAMAKLLKEAVRVKHILSANHESGVNVSYRSTTLGRS